MKPISSSYPHIVQPVGDRAFSSRAVAIWVYTGVIMLLVQVVLGGITRLTGSGLSITEWNVVTGVLPPLDHAQWQAAFDKYRQTPQFHILNADFQLGDFKFIFFWEWFHRFWARMVGMVFLVGFVGLIWKKKLQSGMIRPLVILFLLGALQGAIGWIMVASGLTGDAIYVRPTKLALHFVFALGLVVYAFWFALQLSVRPQALWGQGGRAAEPGGDEDAARGVTERGRVTAGRSIDDMGTRLKQVGLLRGWTVATLVVLFFQLLYGALMAGHKAATVAPTWPSINGSWIPESLFSGRPLSADLIGNTITVQFVHRGMAYLLLIMVSVWTVLAVKLTGVADWWRGLRWLPLSAIGLQILLGITSLLTSPGIIPNRWVVFDWVAELHQIVGLLFLLTITGMLYLVRRV